MPLSAAIGSVSATACRGVCCRSEFEGVNRGVAVCFKLDIVSREIKIVGYVAFDDITESF